MPSRPLMPTTTTEYVGQRLRETTQPSKADYRILALKSLLRRWRREDTSLAPAQQAWLTRKCADWRWTPSAEEWQRLAPRFLAWGQTVGLSEAIQQAWSGEGYAVPGGGESTPPGSNDPAPLA